MNDEPRIRIESHVIDAPATARITEPPHFSQIYLDINKILGRYNW